MFYILDASFFNEIPSGHNIDICDITEIHAGQNKKLVGRLRTHSDWNILYKNWQDIQNYDAKAHFLYVLEQSSKILAYAIFHLDEGNSYAKVPTVL